MTLEATRKAKLLDKIILSLVSNPKVYDPDINSKYRTDFLSLISSGAKFSEEDIVKITKKLNEKNLAMDRLFDCASDVMERLEKEKESMSL